MLNFEELKQKAYINCGIFLSSVFRESLAKHFLHLKDYFQIHPSIPIHIELLYKSKKGKDFLQIPKKEILSMRNSNTWQNKLNTVLN